MTLRRLMAAPDYKGFVAKNYGPDKRYMIPRQSQMYWKMTSRIFFRNWLVVANARKR